MFIADHMSSPPVTVKPDVPIPKVRRILQSNNFRHLPVVDDEGHLLGMVTDRDVRSSYPSTVLLSEQELKECFVRLETTPVKTIMTASIATLTPYSTLDDALLLINKSKIGALPVLDEDQRVIGILSIRDLMKAYKKLFGLGEHGSAMVVVEDDGKGKPLTRIVHVLEEHKIRFTRLIRTKEGEKEDGPTKIYLRVHTYNISAVHAALKEAGFKTAIPTPYGMVKQPTSQTTSKT